MKGKKMLREKRKNKKKFIKSGMNLCELQSGKK